MGFGFVIRFIRHFNIQLVTAFYKITTTYRQEFSVTVITALLSSGFQRWIFPFPCISKLFLASITSFCSTQLTACRLSLDSLTDCLTGWRPFHTNLLLFKLPSQDSFVSSQKKVKVISSSWHQAQERPMTRDLFSIELLR
jgi:hypothetical protein